MSFSHAELIPRKDGNGSDYSRPDVLKQTAHALLPLAKEGLNAVNTKIAGYQDERRRYFLDASRSLSGHLSFFDDSGDNEGAISEFGSRDYRQKVRTLDIVSVDYRDAVLRDGLTSVIEGLEQVAKTGRFVPEIESEAFHRTYHELLETC